MNNDNKANLNLRPIVPQMGPNLQPASTTPARPSSADAASADAAALLPADHDSFEQGHLLTKSQDAPASKVTTAATLPAPAPAEAAPLARGAAQISGLNTSLNQINATYNGLDAAMLTLGMKNPSHAGTPPASWSCGVNASARALAMIGCEIENYNQYLADAPNYRMAHITQEVVGPAPKALADYVNAQLRAQTDSQWRCQAQEHADLDSMMASLRASLEHPTHPSPSLLLYKLPDGLRLHWVLVAGTRRDSPNDLLLIDPSHGLSTWDGGIQDKAQACDLGGHVLRNKMLMSIVAMFGGPTAPPGSDFVGRFNLLAFEPIGGPKEHG